MFWKVRFLSSVISAFSRRPLIELEKDPKSETNGVQEAESMPKVPQTPTVTSISARDRTDSINTVSTIPGPQGQPRMTSMFFVVQALEAIQNSKEGKRKGALKDAIAKALG